jgi:hypothetical protein
MNLFVWSGFRYQDPNAYACTSTSALDMLNFIGLHKTGGDGFIWKKNLSGSMRDYMLRWARVHDTLPGGHGSDPHGWRNLLNFFGWGASAVWAGPNRVYDDRAYGTFEGAMTDTIRALVKTRKPVGLLGRGGAHALMVTGYYGLTGDPFAKDTAGNYTNRITLGGFYVTDPLSSSKMTSKAVTWHTLKFSGDYRIRFKPYYETDSTLDDPYTPGVKRSRDEWYKRFVVILPMR